MPRHIERHGHNRMEGVCDDMARFSSGDEIKGKEAYLESIHVAGRVAATRHRGQAQGRLHR